MTLTNTDLTKTGLYTFEISCTDSILYMLQPIRDVKITFTLDVLTNLPPYLRDPYYLTVKNMVVGRPISNLLLKEGFKDGENDTFYLNCFDNDDYEWLSVDKHGDDYEITGTSPPSNTDWAGSVLTISCKAIDALGAEESFIFKQPLVENKIPRVVATPKNELVKIGSTYVKSFIGVCFDSENDTLTYSMEVNG